jgi:nucleotide-binding universal stress UspA family protein
VRLLGVAAGTIGRSAVRGENHDARLRRAVAVYMKILVAYDDPESGTLARAADLAEETKATLIVTNVVAPVERSEVREADTEARHRLDEAGNYLKRRGLSGELVASVGPPAEAILRLAKEREVDLVVVGTRKKGFFERLVEGSVAQNVLRGASCDVLVVY